MPTGRARGTSRGGRGAPDPVAEPLHRTALQLLRLVRLEDATSGLSPARLSALSVLVFGGPCTLGALAAAEQVSAPTMSRLVTELEQDGWIVRRADPADARATRLTATAAGKRLLLAGRARRLHRLSRGLAALSTSDRRAIANALAAYERLVLALRALPASVDRQRPSVDLAGPRPSSRRRFE